MTNSRDVKKKKKLGKIVEVKYPTQVVWLQDAVQADLTFVTDNCFADVKFSLTFNMFPQEHNFDKVDVVFLDSYKVQKVFNINNSNHIMSYGRPYLSPNREETH